MTLTRITNPDAFETVRDKVAQILATESADQMAQAQAAGDDPALWELKVYTERSHPWELYLNEAPADVGPAPVVNVWFDQDAFDMSQGNVVECQAAAGTINVDVYGWGVSADDGGTGHVNGDELAAKEAQRGARLARQILMASEYTYLGLRPLVSRRWLQARTSMQPQFDVRPVQAVHAVRLALAVKYLEVSPQYEGELLELIHIDLERASDGRVLAGLEYDYT